MQLHAYRENKNINNPYVIPDINNWSYKSDGRRSSSPVSIAYSE